MGLLINVSSNFSNANLPKLNAKDLILTSGSLLLIDTSHSRGGLGTLGVPATASLIPNIAWEEAKAILGSGSESSLSATFVDNHQAADAFFERTAKSGLHGVYSKVGNTNTNRGAGINAPQSIEDYIVANTAHSFYMSVWTRRTRAAGSTAPRFATIGDAGAIMMIFSAAGETAATQIGKHVVNSGANALGNSYRAMAATGILSGGSLTAQVWPMFWGNFLAGASSYSNIAASDIFYRTYIEDLTVSGRTFAEVDAIDTAYYDECFATGGKFYGDTYTDPATLP